jgi:hypothetical protein
MRRSAFSAGRPGGLIREIAWKAGRLEVICLHGGLRFPYIGRMAKNFKADLDFQKKTAIHVARLTIHEVGVRNRPDFSDKLVEDWRWQIR